MPRALWSLTGMSLSSPGHLASLLIAHFELEASLHDWVGTGEVGGWQHSITFSFFF